MTNPPLVAGAVSFADPSFKVGKGVDYGSANANGVSGTDTSFTNYGELGSLYNGRYRSYCAAGDRYCNSCHGVDTTIGQSIHDSEPTTYEQDVANYFVGLLK